MFLIIDSVCRNKKLLTSTEELTEWLVNAVSYIGMKVIGGPLVIDFPAGDGEERGLSGVVILAESSIVVHTYPEHNFVYIDIFSCRDFLVDKVISMVKETFKMEDPVVHTLTRRVIT